jgi:SAM-dependent methyltransferase
VSEVFGASYAGQYDTLYGDKNYAAECDAVETLIRRHARGTVHSLLDLGCGTGTHAFLLADRGYDVTGVDRSAAMLARARVKAGGHARGNAVELTEGDVRTVRTGRTYDAVLMLFAVLGYQTSDDDVASALQTARTHLRPGGVFIFDVWFGPAVLATGPSARTKVIEDSGGVLTRTASGTLDAAHHTCRVDYRATRERGGRLVEDVSESHTMRYFFAPEIEAALRSQQLEPCAMHPFDDIDGVPGADSWNIWACARG